MGAAGGGSQPHSAEPPELPELPAERLREAMDRRIADPRRLQVITELGLSGQDGDIHLDGVLRTLAAACSVPIVALNIVTPGRQTFAAEIGIGQPFAQDDNELSFCASVVATGRRLTVSDAAHHAVLCRCPLVLAGSVGAYAGEPVVHRGVVVGALGIYDARSRTFTETELTVLHELARLVELVLANRYDAHTTNATMLRSLIDRSDSLMYVKDLQGRYLLANPRMASVFGVPEEVLLGRTDAHLSPEQADVRGANDVRALVGDYDRVEYVDLPDGRHTYESTKFPLVDGAGKVYAMGGVSRDVTDSLQAAADLAEARDAAMEGSRQKSAFLATMSHEIRTPMNAVIGMTGLLLGTDLDDEQREFVETVASSGESLMSIIDNILDFSKIEAGGLTLERAPFDPRACAEAALDLVAVSSRNETLEIIGQVAPDCPARVLGDSTRLGQVLVNLLANAVKFTARGEVVLTVEPDPAPDGRPGLRFSVTDSGIGIPADRLESLFESFSQVDASTTRLYGGTGLGLAISQRLVRAMGGTLEVTSTPGVGSTFTFTADLAPLPHPDPVAGRGAGPGSALDGRSALVVDDNAVNRRTLRHQLERWGMTVVEASGAVAAAALIEDGGTYDLALLDMKMPGMSGHDLAVHLRGTRRGADLPLILLSSLADGRTRAAADLFTAVLTKPVKGSVLADCLRGALVAHPTGRVTGAPRDATRGGAETSAPVSVLQILLAEDNPVNQRLGVLLLEKLGHGVEVVGNGAEAVLATRRQRFDAVLMDVEMPVLDGVEASRRIRADNPPDRQPPIIAMTASVLTEVRDGCRGAGMDGFLPKPVRLKDLVSALAEITSPRRTRRTPF